MEGLIVFDFTRIKYMYICNSVINVCSFNKLMGYTLREGGTGDSMGTRDYKMGQSILNTWPNRHYG